MCCPSDLLPVLWVKHKDDVLGTAGDGHARRESLGRPILGVPKIPRILSLDLETETLMEACADIQLWDCWGLVSWSDIKVKEHSVDRARP